MIRERSECLVTVPINKYNSMPTPDISIRIFYEITACQVDYHDYRMTQEQKLPANFNCSLIMVNNRTSYISQSQSIKQQGFAIASKLAIQIWKVFDDQRRAICKK